MVEELTTKLVFITYVSEHVCTMESFLQTCSASVLQTKFFVNQVQTKCKPSANQVQTKFFVNQVQTKCKPSFLQTKLVFITYVSEHVCTMKRLMERFYCT